MTFLGGAKEIGRSAVLVKTAGGARILLDYGVRLDDKVRFPSHVAPKDLDAIVLTHAHLDHSGALPMLFISGCPKLYATESTYQQAEILLRDMMKLNGYYLPFGDAEVKRLVSEGIRLNYYETVTLKDAEISLINAGHIPGSAQVIINADKTLLYTGDFTTVRTRLLSGTTYPGKGFDVVITESTYAREEHPPRPELEQQIVNHVREVVQEGGLAVIPAFSVCRAQEVACILYTRGYRGPLSMDGMATKILSLYLSDERFVDGRGLLSKVAKRINVVKGIRDRRRALETPGVVISPSGMLKGGPAVYYSLNVAEDPLSSIILVSFQTADSPGARLLGDRLLQVDGKSLKVKARVAQYRLSAHAGRKELQEYIESIDGCRVFTMHGEPESCDELSEWINRNTSSSAYAPKPEETLEI